MPTSTTRRTAALLAAGALTLLPLLPAAAHDELTAVTPDERLIAMRRLVALTGGALNLRDLSAALLHWTEERRRRWTYDYWGVGQPAARATTTASGTTAPDKDDAA